MHMSVHTFHFSILDFFTNNCLSLFSIIKGLILAMFSGI